MALLLVITTVASFASVFLPLLIKQVLSVVFWESEGECALQREIEEVKREMLTISMLDEFAKYARCQRRLNRLQQEKSNAVQSRMASQMKSKFLVVHVVHGFMGLVLLYIMWSYKQEPLIVLPKEWLFPFHSLLSWPTGVPGAISVTSWLVISGTTARLLAAKIT